MFNKGTNSFLEFISNHSQRPLREVINEKGAHHYLNYNLSIDTWNLLVNKQIYMKTERLLLHKQITKKTDEERKLLQQIENLDSQISKMREDRIQLENEDMKEKFKRYEIEKKNQNHIHMAPTYTRGGRGMSNAPYRGGGYRGGNFRGRPNYDRGDNRPSKYQKT